MAINYINIGAAGFSKAQRGPIDKNILFETESAMNSFVTNAQGTAYAGQIMSLSDDQNELYKVVKRNNVYSYIPLFKGIETTITEAFQSWTEEFIDNIFEFEGGNRSNGSISKFTVQDLWAFSLAEGDLVNVVDYTEQLNAYSLNYTDTKLNKLKTQLEDKISGINSLHLFAWTGYKTVDGKRFPVLNWGDNAAIRTDKIYLIKNTGNEEGNEYSEWIINPTTVSNIAPENDNVITANDIFEYVRSKEGFNATSDDPLSIYVLHYYDDTDQWWDEWERQNGQPRNPAALFENFINAYYPGLLYEKLGDITVDATITNTVNDVSVRLNALSNKVSDYNSEYNSGFYDIEFNNDYSVGVWAGLGYIIDHPDVFINDPDTNSKLITEINRFPGGKKSGFNQILSYFNDTTKLSELSLRFKVNVAGVEDLNQFSYIVPNVYLTNELIYEDEMQSPYIIEFIHNSYYYKIYLWTLYNPDPAMMVEKYSLKTNSDAYEIVVTDLDE